MKIFYFLVKANFSKLEMYKNVDLCETISKVNFIKFTIFEQIRSNATLL